MVKVKQQEAGEWELLPEDVYEAEVTNITEKETKYGESLSWEFTLVGEGVEDSKVWGMTTTNLVNLDRCKLWNWIKTLGLELEDDQGLDTDDLLGKPCRVLVEKYEGSDNIERNKVKEILSSKRSQTNVKLANEKELKMLSNAFAGIDVETAVDKVAFIKEAGIKHKPTKLDSKDVANILRAIDEKVAKDKPAHCTMCGNPESACKCEIPF